jgi:RND family efflux transporter MFP subunit
MALQDATTYLSAFKNLFADVSNAVNLANNLAPSVANTYKTDLTAGSNEVNAAATNMNNAAQNIAAQKITVEQAQAQLDLTLAGSTHETIDAQAAQVEQAQANVQSIKVKIQKASMVSPVSGVITDQEAKVGQIAMPNTPLVTVISDNNLEVDAFVPEIDIGKMKTGDSVTMTIDAFPGETFSGKVFYIDPAQTVNQGVVDYKIKVSFDKPDPRIKSGLTVNLGITTQTKNQALILPQFAILQNDKGIFVETVANGAVATTTVTTGIRDQAGNVEVLSGVTEGEQVLNIGLK